MKETRMDAVLQESRAGIDAPYRLAPGQVEFFRENGFVKLKDVFDAATLERYRREIAAKVRELNTLHLPMEQRTTYQKAFLQVMNLWTKSDLVREFVFGKRLARLAAELLGVSGVRLYHDQALYKEGKGGFTPWHADQYYWPLSSDRSITAWVPLQETPLEMGPLAFAPRTHRSDLGRDLPISDQSEAQIERRFKEGGFTRVEEPFALGEVSFHLGWTFHRAGRNLTERPREVMTVIYMDEDMRLAAPRNEWQQNDRDTWCPGAEPGEPIRTPLNPLIWSSRA
jgi:ectoine hydroxylase-related dioxygenase (phytanoyl-CoA dioxygenase family)